MEKEQNPQETAMGVAAEGFGALGLSDTIVGKLKELGLEKPTPVQAEAIPPALEGKDAVVRSQTGTGKTLAYLLPILHKMDPAQKQVQAVIVVPTRELGMQIYHEAEKFGEALGLRTQALIGGAALSRQVDKLKLHPQLVVGTPGRLTELLKLKKLTLHHARTIVIDEVDQVLSLGNLQEVETLFRSALRGRQLIFCSATLPEEVRGAALRWMREPIWIQAGPQGRTASTLEHWFTVCEEREKIDTLRRFVRTIEPKAAIAFITDTELMGEVEGKLKYVGLSVGALYADAGKQDRARIMQAFRNGKFQLLLASDVAARGLDLPEVTHVFNLEPPSGADAYVHRAGRTGRMGRRGTVISIMSGKEKFIITKYSKELGIKFQEKVLYEGKIFDPEHRFVRGRAGRAGADKREAAPGGARGGQAPGPLGERAGPGGRRDAQGERYAEQGGSGAAERGGQAPDARTSAARPGQSGQSAKAASAASARPKAPAAAQSRDASRRDRERDRKNKGAPRWLKDKQQQQPNEPR